VLGSIGTWAARLKPVAVESVKADNDTVKIKLRDESKFTRVHVFATRYQRHSTTSRTSPP